MQLFASKPAISNKILFLENTSFSKILLLSSFGDFKQLKFLYFKQIAQYSTQTIIKYSSDRNLRLLKYD